MTREQFDDVCQRALAQNRDFEEKIKKLEFKITGKVSSKFDLNLDQSTLYDNFINDETQGLDEMYDYVRKAHLK